MKFLNDKYFLLCISIIFIIIISSFTISNKSNESQNEILYGNIFDINESSKGFVFQFQDTDGKIRKCYYSSKPTEDAYMISGNYSDDKSIFFISELKIIELDYLSN